MKATASISTSLQAALNRLRKDDGNIAIMAAGLLSFLTAGAVIAVDAGAMHYKQKDLQRIADQAALAASLDTSRGAEIALASIRSNGLNDDALTLVQVGGFNPLDTSGNRFSPGVGDDAVEVRLEGQVSLPFFAALGGADHVEIAARAVAANVPEVGFRARSGLLDFSITNALLSGINSGTINLSDQQYQAMEAQTVNIMDVLEAIADNENSDVANYNELLAQTVTTRAVLLGIADALANDPQSDSVALAAVEFLAAQGGYDDTNIVLQDLVELGTLGARPVGEPGRRTDATDGFSALDVVLHSMHTAGKGQMIALGVPITIPGLLQVTAYVSLDDGALAGGSPSGAPLVVGPEGTSIHASAGEVLLDLHLLRGIGVLGGTQINVPIYIELAGGDVTVTDVSCGVDPSVDTEMTFTTSASFGRAYIASIDPDMLGDDVPITDPAEADIMRVGPVNVTGYAELDLLGSGDQQVTFTMADIEAGRTSMTGNEQITGSLFSSLIDNLVIDVYTNGEEDETGNGNGKGNGNGNSNGIGLGVGGGISQVLASQLLSNLLGGVSSTVDPILSTLLQSLGLRAGYVELGPTDVRCGTPVIIS